MFRSSTAASLNILLDFWSVALGSLVLLGLAQAQALRTALLGWLAIRLTHLVACIEEVVLEFRYLHYLKIAKFSNFLSPIRLIGNHTDFVFNKLKN